MKKSNLKYNKLTLLGGGLVILSALLFTLYGCESNQAPTSAKPVSQSTTQAAGVAVEAEQPVAAVEEPTEPEGYVYDRRDRRDPFIPLITPVKKRTEKDVAKIGTLEGYDIGEFSLAAIAKKGSRYYALLTTVDHRSFTVNEGDVIGLSNGRVEKISSDKVVLVEYERDYKGDLKPRQIILEFFKGE